MAFIYKPAIKNCHAFKLDTCSCVIFLENVISECLFSISLNHPTITLKMLQAH